MGAPEAIEGIDWLTAQLSLLRFPIQTWRATARDGESDLRAQGVGAPNFLDIDKDTQPPEQLCSIPLHFKGLSLLGIPVHGRCESMAEPA